MQLKGPILESILTKIISSDFHDECYNDIEALAISAIWIESCISQQNFLELLLLMICSDIGGSMKILFELRNV